jgi:hypothetical protein
MTTDHGLRAQVMCFFGLVVVGAILYASVLDAFFLADDFGLINAVKTGGPLGVWTWSDGGFFRPLVAVSLFVDYQLWALDPLGYHLTNVTLHAANAFLVGLVAARLARHEATGPLAPGRGFSLAAALVFLALPCHTEAVAWIAGRTDLIVTLFCLTSFLFYLRSTAGGGVSDLGWALLAFACALLAKEAAFAFPLVILIYELAAWARGRTTPAEALRRLLAFALVFLGYVALRLVATGSLGGAFFAANVAADLNLVRPLKNVLLFLAKPFVPPLAFDPAAVATAREALYAYQLPVLVCGLGLALVGLRYLLRRRSAVAAWLGAFVGAPQLALALAASMALMLPVLNLGISFIDTQGERYIYLPSAFYAIALTILGYGLFARARYAPALAVALFVYFAGYLFVMNQSWDQAGSISRGIVGELGAAARQSRQLYVLNLPRHLSGAYISGNAPDALALFYPDLPAERVVVLAYHPLFRPEDAVAVREQGGLYTVELEQPKAAFVTPPAVGPGPGYEVVSAGPRSYQVRFPSLAVGDVVMAYSAGRVTVIQAGYAAQP